MGWSSQSLETGVAMLLVLRKRFDEEMTKLPENEANPAMLAAEEEEPKQARDVALVPFGASLLRRG